MVVISLRVCPRRVIGHEGIQSCRSTCFLCVVGGTVCRRRRLLRVHSGAVGAAAVCLNLSVHLLLLLSRLLLAVALLRGGDLSLLGRSRRASVGGGVCRRRRRFVSCRLLGSCVVGVVVVGGVVNYFLL